MRRAFLTEAREVARRDLHDGVLQSLAALRMRLLTIIQSQELAPAANAEIRNTAEIIALEQARLRSLLDENVDADQPVNLFEALRLCVKTTALQWEIDVEFVSDETAIPMHRESANNVEYLLREVIANAARHSGSKELRCSLALRDHNLIISLMDLSATPARLSGDFHNGPLSSHSLRQRLSLVNGRAYSDGLQTGTLLAIAIPLTYDEADL
nr:histidine kinase [Sphingobium nicotianae]